jgi:hypothetical protein
MRNQFLLIGHDQTRMDPPDVECLPVEGFECGFLQWIRPAGNDGGYRLNTQETIVFREQGNGFVLSMN